MSKQSLIGSLPLQRVEPCSPHEIPLQWSENNQLAINTSNQLIILDPKLPSLHHSISTTNNKLVKLNLKTIFSVTNILNSEVQDKLPLRNFQSVVVDSLDESFALSNHVDLMIIQHQWSPVSPQSKNCYLGVLFNSGELIIFERNSITIDSYQIKFNMFKILLDQFNIPQEDQISVNTSQFANLKIKSFAFNSPNYLSIVTNRNTFFYKLVNDDITLLGSVDFELDVIKQIWSPFVDNVSYLSLVTSNNSVQTVKIECSDDGLSIGNSHQIITASRFLNHQNKWILSPDDELIFLSVFTGKLMVYRNSTLYQQSLDNYYTCCGIITHFIKDDLIIILAFDDGSFVSYSFSLSACTFTLSNFAKLLTNFVNRSLYSFQLVNSTAQDTEEDGKVSQNEDGEDNAMTRLYLNQAIEGQFVNYGITNNDGIVTFLFKITPKNVVSYSIASQSEVVLAFVKVEDLQNSVEDPVIKFEGLHKHHKYESKATSIGYLANLWLTQFATIPLFPDFGVGNKEEKFKQYQQEIEKFKHDHFTLDVDLHIDHVDDLGKSLIKNFNENPAVNHLQYLVNFDKIILDSLSKLSDINGHLDYVEKIVGEINKIKSMLTMHLVKIILNVVQTTEIVQNEFDKFLIINLYHRLKQLDNSIEYKNNIPEEVTITIRTKFFEESFAVSINDIDLQEDLIKSTTDHKWSTCKLTHIPLLQLNSRKDELGEYNFILSEEEFGPLTQTLLQTVQYCFLTGNKNYSIN